MRGEQRQRAAVRQRIGRSGSELAGESVFTIEGKRFAHSKHRPNGPQLDFLLSLPIFIGSCGYCTDQMFVASYAARTIARTPAPLNFCLILFAS